MATTELPLLIEPQDLAAFLAETPQPDTPICIVDLSSEQSYQSGHIPGAVHLPAQALICGYPPAAGKLPGDEQLNRVFSHLGLTPDTHFIVYDDEGGGWAGRFIWTLDVIGHQQYSYVNGGILAWRGEGLPVETQESLAQPTDVNVQINEQPIAEIPYILGELGNQGFVIWDARSPEEYRGEKVLAQKGGHIPGAINCEWTSLMDPDNHFRILADAEERLGILGIRKGQSIVTHCQSHHRSGFTYLVGKILGFSIKGYHGSWSEWGNHPDTPVEEASL
ncbi:sulfurtransferase [Teredinibacter turnerae]|uniref:sulfurtransferase n=1 Tax=Teredinibacter turnerae TaxID=2426 RepID=UPI00036A5EF4|nr:rhodanese-like domain-containing protein [Teredinibacter turnerae]